MDASASGSAPSPSPPPATLIRGALVLAFADAGGARVERRDVRLRGERIDELAEPGALEPEANERHVDGRDRLLTPGLINAHAHGAMTLFRGAVEDVPPEVWFNDHIWRMETRLGPDDVYWGVRLAAAEMLAAGVTAVADHYFEIDAVAAGYRDGGMRALLAPTLFGRDPDAELAAAAASIDRWHGAADDRLRVWVGPHSPYLCSDELLAGARDLAAERGVGLHLHVSETADQVAQSRERFGRTPPERLDELGVFEVPTLVAHAAHATESDLPILARASGVAHCPKTFLKMALGLPRVDRMLAAGVRVALGSDGAASNATLDVLEQLRLTALLQKHLAGDARVLPLAALPELATAAGGATLGWTGLGAVAPGAPADLVLWRLDRPHAQPLHDPLAALVYTLRGGDVDTVWVAGEVRVENGAPSIDPAETFREVAARVPRLVAEGGDARMQRFPG